MTSLSSVKNDLDEILRDLREVATGIRDDFKGIGSERCASCIELVIEKYQKVRNMLNDVDELNIRGQEEPDSMAPSDEPGDMV